MGKGKGIAIAVLVLAVAAVVVWRNRESPLVPTENEYVCVTTGKTYVIDIDDVRSVPTKNPDTGEMTLVPVVREGAELRVDGHYRPIIEAFDGEVNQYVDPNTLVVRKP